MRQKRRSHSHVTHGTTHPPHATRHKYNPPPPSIWPQDDHLHITYEGSNLEYFHVGPRRHVIYTVAACIEADIAAVMACAQAA